MCICIFKRTLADNIHSSWDAKGYKLNLCTRGEAKDPYNILFSLHVLNMFQCVCYKWSLQANWNMSSDKKKTTFTVCLVVSLCAVELSASRDAQLHQSCTTVNPICQITLVICQREICVWPGLSFADPSVHLGLLVVELVVGVVSPPGGGCYHGSGLACGVVGGVFYKTVQGEN